VLVVPKGSYVDADHFGAEASEAELADIARVVSQVARSFGVAKAAGGSGFRVIANSGEHGRQDVPHYHVHVLGGEKFGRMLPKRDD
jgi:histidine triad (HIT) family protein